MIALFFLVMTTCDVNAGTMADNCNDYIRMAALLSLIVKRLCRRNRTARIYIPCVVTVAALRAIKREGRTGYDVRTCGATFSRYDGIDGALSALVSIGRIGDLGPKI